LTEEKMEKNGSFTCPNASCGRIFSKPLKALNVQLGADAMYDCCPYCLTGIAELEEKTETVQAEKEPAPQEPTSCAHHLGFLCERQSKESIPDECILCKDIVACMLSNLKR
jgi:hypothetical protein